MSNLLVLDKLKNNGIGNAELIASLQVMAQSPLLLHPTYIDAYIRAVLTSDVPVIEGSWGKSPKLYGESNYHIETNMPVNLIGSTAILEVTGGLVNRAENGMCGDVASYEGFTATLDTLMNDDSIHDVIIRASSGGGILTGMEHASRYLKSLTGQGKKIYTLSNDASLSASCGLLSGSDEIWGAPDALHGSVGVYQRHVSYEEQNEKRGIEVTYVYNGKYKLLGSPDQKLSQGDIDIIGSGVKEAYGMFTELVAEHMGMALKDVVSTEARLYSSKEAVGLGLAHNVGTLPQLIKHIEDGHRMTDAEKKVIQDEAIAGHVEKQAQAKVARDAQAKVEADALLVEQASTRSVQIKTMCAFAGLSAEHTKAYIDGTDSYEVVAEKVKALSSTTDYELDNSGATKVTPKKAVSPWADVNWN